MGAASSLVIGQSSIAPVSPFGSANSDYDTLTNAEEITVGTNPALTDTDGDFITDSDELSITLTNPLLADSNGDGLSDYVNWVTAHPQLWDVNRNALWDARDLQFNDYSSYQGIWWATAHLIDTDGDGISDHDEFWYGNWHKYKYWHNDSDGDGILDGVEWNGPDHWLPTDYDHDGLAASSEYNTNPNNPDSDGDGLPDGVDSFFRTQAHVDSDNDGLNDLEELLNGSSPSHGDYDEDWLDDSQERILGTNPFAYDTDMDGLSDGAEFYGTLIDVGPTDPLFIDSDGDFLTDFEEQWSWYATTASYFNGNLLDPNNPDTDGDGVLDYFEVNLTDTDNGGVPDVMERYYGLNPLLSSDDIGDLDNDGETNVVEYQNGTLLDGNYGPRYDWDRDGMTNVWEIAQGLDPTDPLDAYDDPDGDYLFNIEEYQARTNPHLVLTPGAQLIVILTLDPTTFSVVHIPARTDYEAAMRSALPAGLVRGNGPDAQREHEDDWDGDGLTNRSEMLDDPFTSPRTPTADADGDSLPSAWEISMTLNPLNGDQNTSGTNDRDDDFDQDTLTNHAELLAGTHPRNSDTDADGLPDGWEISFGLNPLDASGDHGGTADPDGDGLTNHEELVLHGTDPLNADTDDDGLPDDWELKYGLDPNNNTGPDGADGDVDGDGNGNAVEFAGGSDPRSNASRPMPEIQIRREVNWPGGSYTATEGFGFIITRAGDSSPSYEDFETDDAHDAPGRYHHAAADGDYPEIDIPMFSRYQITALGSEAMSAPLARNYLIVKKKYSSDSELISTEYGTLKVSFAHGASPAAYEVHGSMAGEFVVSGGFLEVRPHKVHNGIAMIDFLPVEIVNNYKAAVSELKVSKMQDSTDPSNVLDIDTDDDRFYVRIPGLAGSQSVSIKLETVENPLLEYNDNPTEIELVQTNSAWETPSLILVSDQEDDDEYLGDIGRDDQTNDRSHKIQLGGKVRVSEIKINGTSHNFDLKVQVPVKERATIHAVVLADAGNVDLAAEEKTTNERLAQVGVKITLVGGDGVKPIPPGLTDTTIRNWIPIRNEPSLEAKALIDAYGTSTLADIHVFFVKATTEPNGTSAIAGFALWGDDARNGAYGNNAFVHAQRKPFTFVHELVHLFTKRGHYHHPAPNAAQRDYGAGGSDHKTRHNLMRFGTSVGRDFGGSKRLYEEADATQETWIKAHETVQ